jgi:sec-independent protein translocase protein TatB
MFEFDAGKFVIIGIVALIVIGPKELPRVMRQVGQAIAKLRRLSAEFQAQFMDAMHEADLAEIKAEAAKISEAVKLDTGIDVSLDPLADIRTELTKNIEAREAGTPEPVLGARPPASEPLVESSATPPHEDPPAALDAGAASDDATLEPLPIAADMAAREEPGLLPAADVAPLRKRG